MNLLKLSAAIILVMLGLSGCTGPTSPPSSTLAISFAGNDITEITVETISQPNCGGTAEVETNIQKSRSLERVLETQNGVEVNANGQVGFAGTDIELGATVASQLGYSYGTVENIARSLTVKAKPGANMQHSIKLMEVWQLGTAKIIVGDQETTIPFRFKSDFIIELIGSQDLGCNNLEPTSVPGTSENFPTLPPSITSCAEINGIELLSESWHLEAENGDAQMYQEVDPNILLGKSMLSVTYNLHGLEIREGERKDESAIIFDQTNWFVVSLANYGQNGLDGEQTVFIPLSDFVSLPDAPSDTDGGASLNLDAPVGTLHTRFWRSEHFTVDIISICIYS